MKLITKILIDRAEYETETPVRSDKKEVIRVVFVSDEIFELLKKDSYLTLTYSVDIHGHLADIEYLYIVKPQWARFYKLSSKMRVLGSRPHSERKNNETDI